MSFTSQQSTAFTAARLGLKTALMKAGGWDVGHANQETIAEPAMFFYVYDQQTSWTWLCSVPKRIFYGALAMDIPYAAEVAAAGAAQIVKLASVGSPEDDWEEKLAKLLSAYIVKTKTYEQAGQGKLASHFLLVHYGKSGNLRPTALAGSDQYVLPVDKVLQCFDFVIAHDLQRNPQWVRG